jgi:hypothetical protein
MQLRLEYKEFLPGRVGYDYDVKIVIEVPNALHHVKTHKEVQDDVSYFMSGVIHLHMQERLNQRAPIYHAAGPANVTTAKANDMTLYIVEMHINLGARPELQDSDESPSLLERPDAEWNF